MDLDDRAVRKDVHEIFVKLRKTLPSDFEPWGNADRDQGGADCSCGCKHFIPLEGSIGADWGVCCNPESPRAGLLTFEHQGCPEFEGDCDEGPIEVGRFEVGGVILDEDTEVYGGENANEA